MAEARDPYVYVSHHAQDLPLVEPLVLAIQAGGVRVERDSALSSGVDWTRGVAELHEGASAVVIVWSAASATSSFIEREGAQADADGKLMIVALSDPDLIPRRFKAGAIHDLRDWDGDPADARLTDLIADLVGRTGSDGSGPIDRTQVDLSVFSRSVRAVHGEMVGEVTASAMAAGLQRRHGEYAGGALASATLRPEAGPTATADTWLARVLALYDLDEVKAKGGGVLHGRLLLAGLARLDPTLAEDLARHGVSEALAPELSVQPRPPGPAEPTPSAAVHERDTDIGFAADMVGDRQKVTAEQDLLGINDDVRTLCRLVLARSTKPPVAIGLFGDWGAGKSFFLQRMRSQIEEMTTEAGSTVIGTSSCEHVVQVTFNAWHYLDADLWASIANRLYRAVADVPGTSEKARNRLYEELASTGEARVRAGHDRTRAEAELRRLNGELRDRAETMDRLRSGRLTTRDAVRAVALGLDANEHAGEGEGSAELKELVADARFGRGLFVAVTKNTNKKARILAAIAVVATAAVIVGVVLMKKWGLKEWGWAAPAAALLTSIASGAAAWWKGIRTAYRGVRREAERARKLLQDTEHRLRADIDAFQRQVDEAKVRQDVADETLAELRRGGLVRRYLSERLASSPYRERLGLVSLVREDLERLSVLLDPKSPESIDAQIDRIVLYVDDLDRCPPNRVVEVLQAVHLLLAFPLFVVVVAVDARWLLTSLELHYRDLLGSGNEASLIQEWELTPTNYLEKIFQIPLALRPMTPDGYRRLVAGLAPVRRPPPETEPATEPSPPGSAGEDGGVTTAAPQAADVVPEVGAPISVFDHAVSGNILQLGFSEDGRRLVIITTRGVWRWDRGRPALRQVLDLRVARYARSPAEGPSTVAGNARATAPSDDAEVASEALASISADGHVVGVVDENNTLHVVDLRTGQRKVAQPTTDVSGTRFPFRPRGITVANVDAVMAASAVGPRWWVGHDHQQFAAPVAVDMRAVWLSTDDEIMLVYDGARIALTDGSTVLGDDEIAFELGVSRTGDVIVFQFGGLRRFTVQPTEPELVRRGDRVTLGEEVPRPSEFGRSRGAWWIRAGDGSTSWWPDDDEVAGPTPLPFPLVGDRLAADPAAPLVVGWGSHGFEVADRTAILYHADTPVECIAISPLGSLVATVGGGRLNLWRVTGADTPELPGQLELEPEEADFLGALAPLVPTPRMAKRLVNVYRLLRASAAGRGRLADPSTYDYRAALLLLVLVIAWPATAARVFEELEDAGDTPWVDLVGNLHRGASGDSAEVLQHVLDLSAAPTPSALALYVEWAAEVRRFYVHPQARPSADPPVIQAPPEGLTTDPR